MQIKQDTQQLKKLFKRCIVFFFALLSVVMFGAVGYRIIEGWPLYDGIYMAVITIASVGYREIGDLSPQGRLFTEILIFMGITTIASWGAVMTSLLIDADLRNYFRRKAMIDKISKMKNHTIVCGGGNTGIAIIQELSIKGVDIVLIENNKEAIKHVEYKFPKVAIVEGNATSEEALWIANVKAAKNLIASLASDVDNLFVVITARDLHPNLFVVARIFDDSTAQRVLKAGANEVVSPNKLGGQKMAQLCFAEN